MLTLALSAKGALSICSPARADMVAALGETTGQQSGAPILVWSQTFLQL